jgi:hypothetical protein
MTPKELIKDKLNEYEKALHKSFESFRTGKSRRNSMKLIKVIWNL